MSTANVSCCYEAYSFGLCQCDPIRYFFWTKIEHSITIIKNHARTTVVFLLRMETRAVVFCFFFGELLCFLWSTIVFFLIFSGSNDSKSESLGSCYRSKEMAIHVFIASALRRLSDLHFFSDNLMVSSLHGKKSCFW